MSRLDLDMTAKIWRSALPHGIKQVLLCFTHHFNAAGGLSWPGIPRVARMCGMSERTVQGHTRALERTGLLRARLRTGRTTHYSIHLDSLAPLVFNTGTVVLDAPELTPAVVAENPQQSAPQPAKNDTKPVEICTLTGDLTSKNAALTAAPALPQALLLADGVNPQVLADFAAIRAKKKLGALNATALDALRSEAASAGLTLAQVLKICCSRNWGRFEAAWLADSRRSPASSANAASASAASAAATVPAPPAGPPPVPVKLAAPEVVAAGCQRLQEIRKTIPNAPALPDISALPAGASAMRMAADAPGWAVGIVHKAQSGQFVTSGVLRSACLALKIAPASVRRAQAGPAGLSAGRMH